MAATIAHFVAMEVGGVDTLCRIEFFTALRHGALITVFRMKMVVDVAAEIGSAMEPWTGADKNISTKPLRAVVAGGSTGVGRDIVIAVRTIRGWSYVDGDLSLSLWGGNREADTGNSGYEQNCKSTHDFTSQ
ncbi:MAG TPA: hypothetical protein VK724_15995 [Bryobacteraceae bacterium]|jgi:hypothetical protein|nr:hypothetical protein [Bryobacteraceae bacterium]